MIDIVFLYFLYFILFYNQLMLDKKNNYIILDFETTGLDHEKDDVIQIWLVHFDHNFSIIWYYNSFINPGYDIDSLKNIVSYTTGITIDQIKSGKSIKEVISDISHFFDKNTVIVWQNILFDIKFLQKYHKFSYKCSLDTLVYAKTLYHYLPSYSLDVIWDHLQKNFVSKDDVDRLLTKFDISRLSNHDALSDCIITYLLFYHCIRKIYTLADKFELLPYILRYTDSDFLNILDQDRLSVSDLDISTISNNLDRYIPPILPYKFEDSPIWYEDNQDFVDRERYYHGNLPPSQFIRLFLNKKLIISTNNKQKLTIIKSILHNYGVKNISFAKSRNGLDTSKLLNIIKQGHYSGFEALFFIKYFSHIDSGLSIMDLNQSWDYKIFNYSRIEKVDNGHDIVLTTHAGLYSMIAQDNYKDHHIIFLDYEWWSSSYLRYASTGYDISNLPKIIDNFIYKYKLQKVWNFHDKLVLLMSKLDVLVWVFFMDIKNYLPNLTPNKYWYLELGVVDNHPYFAKTNYLYQELLSEWSSLSSYTASTEYQDEIKNDLHTIWQQFDKLHNYLHSIVSVVVKDYNGYISYDLVQTQNFIDYSEFINIFGDYKISLFSDSNDNFVYIWWSDKEEDRPIDFITIIETLQDMQDVMKYDKVFILNNNQNHAKKIFDRWLDNQTHYEHKLFVENVTWSKWKNLYLSKWYDKLIVVWSYETLFMYKIEGIRFDKIYTYGQLWALHKQICDDVRYRIG